MSVSDYVKLDDLCKKAQIAYHEGLSILQESSMPSRKGRGGIPLLRIRAGAALLKRLQDQAAKNRARMALAKVGAIKEQYEVVYFIRCNEFVKIGFAIDVAVRMELLQAGCPYKLDLLCTEAGGLERERELHAAFREDRVRGEWFALSARLETYIGHLVESEKSREKSQFWELEEFYRRQETSQINSLEA